MGSASGWKLIIKKIAMDESTLKHCRETLKKNGFQALKKLGMGGFGVVFLVEKLSLDSQLYSVKCTYKKQFAKKPAMRRYLKQEITLMQTLDSPNLVHLYGTFEDDGWIFMIMEYCDLGNLSMIQSQKPGAVFPVLEAIQVVCDVISGLRYMHDKKILHRDIKPQNILQKREKGRVVTKICDLGFSREARDDVKTFCGTTYFMAPEIFGKKNYDHNVDTWALGVLFYSMLFGTVPFKSINMLGEIQTKCKNGFSLQNAKLNPNPSINKQKMDELSSLFALVFKIKPNERITLGEFEQRISNDKAKKDCYRTLDSETSDDDHRTQAISFQLEEVMFIQSVRNEVSRVDYLEAKQLLAFNYFLDKVCLSILVCERKINDKREQEIVSKILASHNEQGKKLLQNIKECGIPKLAEVFTGKPTIIFREYKEEYRLAVGHAFFKAHKQIKDLETKTRLKLKIFCCHVINRIFQKEYNSEIFKHYHEWASKMYPNRGKQFAMDLFQEWLEKEKVQNIAKTVELVNNKFYRKNGK